MWELRKAAQAEAYKARECVKEEILKQRRWAWRRGWVVAEASRRLGIGRAECLKACGNLYKIYYILAYCPGVH